MVNEVHIQNFKSVVDLKMPLGRFNVLIGENGCGKSNILEAIAFASAASAGQLDIQALERRGMRVPSPTFMYSAFEKNENKDILVSFTLPKNNIERFVMRFNENVESGEWIDVGSFNAQKIMKHISKDKGLTTKELIDILKKDFNPTEIINITINVNNDDTLTIKPIIPGKEIANFKIYSPDERSLRRFDNPDNTVMRVDGMGLFSFLKKLSVSERGAAVLQEIRDNMNILDWFDDMQIPQDNLSGENTLRFHDQYIDDNLAYFDQRSVNEAFLYLLFYFTLFISDSTPAFFAIDNIESALNPKLCRKFVSRLIELSKKYEKQVIVTTHNPFVLDALDLKDKEQGLFVARRDIDGHTQVNRLDAPKDNSIPLSEAWMKGYIGGLPNNF